MADASSFKVGDKVMSPIDYQGVVTKIENGTVYVRYSGPGGMHNEGIYSPEWFTKWPNMLKTVASPPKR